MKCTVGALTLGVVYEKLDGKKFANNRPVKSPIALTNEVKTKKLVAFLHFCIYYSLCWCSYKILFNF